jgi:hypothetical protein
MLSSRLLVSASRRRIGALATPTAKSSKIAAPSAFNNQSRALSLRPALSFWTPSCSSSEQRKESYAPLRLHNSLPSTSIIFILPAHQRFMSTNTTTKSPPDKSGKELDTESTNSNSTKDDESPAIDADAPIPASAAIEDDFLKDQHEQQQRSSLRDRFSDRASGMRDNVSGHYTTFREHPGASARKGAKSVGDMFRMYGPVFVGTYATIYVSTLGALYAGVQSGALDPVALFGWLGQDTGDCHNTVDLVVDFMQKHTWTEAYAPSVEKHPQLANLAVAWIATKFTEPIRLGLALPLTPRVARYFGYGPQDPDPVDEPETDISAAEVEAKDESMPDQAKADTNTSSSKISTPK